MFEMFDALVLAAGIGGGFIVRDLFRAAVLGLIVRGVRSDRSPVNEETQAAERVRSALDDRVRAAVRRSRGGVRND